MDEWFVDTAKAAIHKLSCWGTCGSESEPEPEAGEHIALHGEIADSEERAQLRRQVGSERLIRFFCRLKNDDLESPVYNTSLTLECRELRNGQAFRCRCCYRLFEVYITPHSWQNSEPLNILALNQGKKEGTQKYRW